MRCPEDRSELETADYKGVPLKECPKCRGRWFDRDELRKAKDRTDDDLRWLDFDPFAEEADRFAVPSKGKRCPKDSTAMEALTYERSGVVIDRCPRCRGVWLNHGEFEKIIQYLEQIVSSEPSPQLAQDALKQLVTIPAGPKGVISEVRDFLAILQLLAQRLAVEHPRTAKAADRLYRLSPLK